ncbi:RHS repeat-associated core domain-containing protein, partial [Leptospira interrogans]|uniref:RHS repeat-associated core domain-containing protein n=1 Tax=Leptospira interrogans TaxID=173 RepID=UPI000A62FD42
VSPGVPSIQNSGVGMTGGGSVGGMPVTGMYFYHPNYLGSITMITDGAGNPASGPEPGVSFVSYEPYGSIIRNDSYGPDIFRFKFTGQIEDKETGLYYYKSRFYEPTLGRFLQADSVVMPTNVNGMNRYMYVDGNPVNYRDESGNRISTPLAWGLVGAAMANQSGLTQEQGFLIGYAVGNKIHRDNKKSDFEKVIGGIGNGIQRATFVQKGKYYMNGTKLWDSTIGNKGIYGWTVHNALYPGQLFRGTATDKALGELRTFFAIQSLSRISSAKTEKEREEAQNDLIFLWFIAAPTLAPGAGNHGLHQKLW